MKNKVIEADLELLNALNMSEDELKLENKDVELVIKCFNEDFYTSSFKIKNTFYYPFAGIYDLGGLFKSYIDIFPITNLDESAKLIAMLHGTHSCDANLSWLVSNVNNPSISECVCFRDEIARLDNANENHRRFLNEIEYLPTREWVERHTKMVFAIALVFLREPEKYYKALYMLKKDAFKTAMKHRDNINYFVENRDINIEIAYASIVDFEDRGYDPEEIFEDEQRRNYQ